jgi:hypothetical protein
MRKERKHYTAEEKVAILRRHLVASRSHKKVRLHFSVCFTSRNFDPGVAHHSKSAGPSPRVDAPCSHQALQPHSFARVPLRPVDPGLRRCLIVVRISARQQYAAIAELCFSHVVPLVVHLAGHNEKLPARRVEDFCISASTSNQ